MKGLVIFLVLLKSSLFSSFGQSSTGKVNSLIATENYFAAIVKEKGIRIGFLKLSDSETVLFRSDPVKAELFFDKKSEDTGQLSWEPVYAKISRSGDWGFTTGPYIYTQASDSVSLSFGQYVSIWRTNKKGVWKLALDLRIPHEKPKSSPTLNFSDPENFKFFNQISTKRLNQREDMIMTSDRLFSNTLKMNQGLAYNVFLGDDARLLFAGFEPIIGKTNISNFLSQNELNIVTEPIEADRALGSDLAYTYGTANITKNNESAKYNYVRIWEAQEGHKWNVILEIFALAGKE